MARRSRCSCGSRRLYSKCCQKYLEASPCAGIDPEDTFLESWARTYGPVNAHEFARRTRPFVFRISCLLQAFLDRYMAPPMIHTAEGLLAVDDPLRWIEHNTLLSIFGALGLLQQGLFIQSGVLLRSVLENCFVLIDVSKNQNQMKLLLQDKYSVAKVVNRTRQYLPDCIPEWYGYFSRNFAHFGPLHPAPLIPTKCWRDNWVLVVGLQNIVRASVAFGIVLERLHWDRSVHPVFWKQQPDSMTQILDDEAPVWKWVDELGQEIVASYPPGERKDGFLYSEKKYRLKCQKPSPDKS